MPHDATAQRAIVRSTMATARELAIAAAAMVHRAERAGPRRDVRRKGEGDFVTAVDLRVERFLRAELARRHPTHGFLGEESGHGPRDAELVWIVDPIDGTSNFAQGLPCHAVSIACVREGQPIAAAVAAAPRGELVVAGLGRGAFFCKLRLRLAAATLSDAAVIGAQWLRGVHEPALLRALCTSGARVRVFGSTVTQLCDVAVGRLHANVQTQGRIWDLAAAALIAAEAGALVTDWRGRALLPFGSLAPDRHHPSLVAAPGLHAELVARLPRARPTRG
ncbi:MAG: inositol monophosphatase [Planctomycetes bacterium]|nr:inositol monophosphatase [Planctomycetota bacterium]